MRKPWQHHTVFLNHSWSATNLALFENSHIRNTGVVGFEGLAGRLQAFDTACAGKVSLPTGSTLGKGLTR